MIFANKLRDLREQHGVLQRQIAAALEIDSPMYSRIERGERRAKEEQVRLIAEYYGVDFMELRRLWLADQVYGIIADDLDASEVLNIVAENIAEYGTNKNRSI